MTNVYGPFDSAEWETLLMLRKAIKVEATKPGEMCSRDKECFSALLNKAA